MGSFLIGAVVGGVFSALGMVYLVGSGLVTIKAVDGAHDTSEFDDTFDEDGDRS